MLILGFQGRARHGKTTAANAIERRLRDKEIMVEQYDIGQMVLKSCIENKLVPDKPRSSLAAAELAVLIEHGKQKRDKDPYYWIMKIKEEMREDNPGVALIPNVRFQTEVDFVKDRSGFLIRVVSLNPSGTEYISPDRDPNDVTETGWHSVLPDYYITAYRGQNVLVRDMAVAIIDHILDEKQ